MAPEKNPDAVVYVERDNPFPPGSEIGYFEGEQVMLTPPRFPPPERGVAANNNKKPR